MNSLLYSAHPASFTARKNVNDFFPSSCVFDNDLIYNRACAHVRCHFDIARAGEGGSRSLFVAPNPGRLIRGVQLGEAKGK